MFLPLLLLACGPGPDPLYDYGTICAASSADGATLEVTASSDDCSGDHDGVEFTCEVSVDGGSITVSTTYIEGDDPNDGCAPPSLTDCAAALPPGDYELTFAGESWSITAPLEQTLCIPGGDSSLDTGG